MNANQQYPNAYYQGAPGYPKAAYPTPPPPPNHANMQNGHWPPQPHQMSPAPAPGTKKPGPYPGQPIEQQQQPPQSPYHSQSAYQPHPNAYYARPPMHNVQQQPQQQYPPANMSPQPTARHYPGQPPHQGQQRFSNSYQNTPFRNDSEGKTPYPYAPNHNAPPGFSYEQQQQQASARPSNMPQQQQQQSYSQQHQQNMYPSHVSSSMPSPNMSPFPQRHYIEPRNFGNHMNHDPGAVRMRQFSGANAAMNSNYSQPRLQMANSPMATPPTSQMTPVKPNASMHPSFLLRSQSPSPSPAPVVTNDSAPIKKEVNDRHLRQALSAANVPLPIVSKDIVKIATIETTKPMFKRIRPLTNIGPVDNRKILMSLKSGLLAETTWAFDVLNILSNNGTYRLSSAPSLLTNLMDYYKRYLNSIFTDLLDDTENVYQVKLNHDHPKSSDLCKEEFDNLIRKNEKVYLLDATNYTFTSRNGLSVHVKNEPRINSSSGLPIVNDFSTLENNGDLSYINDGNERPTSHIITKMDPINELLPFSTKCSNKSTSLVNGDDAKDGSAKKCKRKLELGNDAELYRLEMNPTLCPRRESLESLSKRCHCLSTIIRNLSFMPENAVIMSHNAALLLVLSRLLAFSHEHHEKKSFAEVLEERENKSQEKENKEATEIFSDHSFETLHLIRMNTFVTISNMGEFLELSDFPDNIILPLLDSMLHWGVCQSSYAKDPHPPDSLSFQLLALETIAKLSMKVANIDLFLATPPFSRIEEFYQILVRSIRRDEDLVLRELSIVILANFASADSLSARIILHLDYSIYNLLTFIEQYEYLRRAQLFNRFGNFPEPFTVTYMLKQAALTLRTMATECDRKDLLLIKKYEERILDLVMSHVLEPEVTQALADLMFILSNSDKRK